VQDEKRRNQARKIERLIQQWDRSVRSAIQGSRKDKRLTQERLAERMAWTIDRMSNVEQGRTEITVSEFIVLAQQMGVDPEVMFRRVLKW
jgi:transcriptional regulator with XRE-family HTH domain